MLKGFKQFLLRGNVVDLAVGFVVGAAFTAVVTAMVDGLIDPLIAAVFGEPDLETVGTFTLNGAEFSLGLVLSAAVKFLLVAAAVYFLVVLPVNKLLEMQRRRQGTAEEPVPVEENTALLREIRDLLADRGTGGGT